MELFNYLQEIAKTEKFDIDFELNERGQLDGVAKWGHELCPDLPFRLEQSDILDLCWQDGTVQNMANDGTITDQYGDEYSSFEDWALDVFDQSEQWEIVWKHVKSVFGSIGSKCIDWSNYYEVTHLERLLAGLNGTTRPVNTDNQAAQDDWFRFLAQRNEDIKPLQQPSKLLQAA